MGVGKASMRARRAVKGSLSVGRASEHPISFGVLLPLRQPVRGGQPEGRDDDVDVYCHMMMTMFSTITARD